MTRHLEEAITARIDPGLAPDGAPRPTLSLAHVHRIARETGTHVRQVELAALHAGVTPERYLRNRQTYDITDQIRLLEARAAVVGLGGLGGTVIEILARAGVGALVLIDGDRFEAHNLNRQLLCTEAYMGNSKATIAAQRVAEINDAVQATVHTVFLTEENARDLIAGCQVVVDCLDTIETRFMVEQAAREAGIPMISAAVAGLTGHVTTIFPGDRGLEMVHGPRHHLKSAKGAEAVLGNVPQTVVMAAAMECSEALKVLTCRTGPSLRNKLWIMDLTDNTFEVLSLV